MITTTW